MAMQELLTVTLNSKQVREACEQWARERTLLNGSEAAFNVEGIDDSCVVRVVARKKRVRNSKEKTV